MTSRSRQAAYSISFLIHLKRKQVIFIFKSKPVIIVCTVRGSIPSYKLMQATDNIPEDITFKAYYLPYKKNNVTSLSLNQFRF